MEKKQAFQIKGAFAIYKNGELFLGELQYALLKALISEGSINAAARKCGISYQQAWTLTDRMNRISPVPVLIKKKGGKDGGGCRVGGYGKLLVELYEGKKEEFSQSLSDLNDGLEGCLI